MSLGQFRFVFTALDFERSKEFYQHALQLGVDHEWDFGPQDRGICFKAGAGMVEIFSQMSETEYISPRGVSMLIEVKDVDKAFLAAQRAGAAVVHPPQDFPWGQRIARFQDPDGIVVGMFTPINP